MRLLRLLGPLCFLLAGCATAPGPSADAADLADTARAAGAVYHCAVTTADGTPRFTLREVWHHAATRGPAPAVGTEILPRTRKSLPDPAVTAVIVFLFDPPVLLPDGVMTTQRTVFVFGDQVPSFGRSLPETAATVRRLVRSP